MKKIKRKKRKKARSLKQLRPVPNPKENPHLPMEKSRPRMRMLRVTKRAARKISLKK